MSKTLVVYGSSTGTCEGIANTIGEKLGAEVVNISDLTKEQAEGADNLILGTSTWGAGDMQDDWYDGLDLLKGCNLEGKKIALFGCGDSEGYSDTFCGGMHEIYDGLQGKGATFIGQVPTDGYTFDDSPAVQDGKFEGLALDEDNESDKTEERIDAWIADIKPQL